MEVKPLIRMRYDRTVPRSGQSPRAPLCDEVVDGDGGPVRYISPGLSEAVGHPAALAGALRW